MASCFTVLALASQSRRDSARKDRLPRMDVMDDPMQVSISLLGRLRVRTQSTKLAQRERMGIGQHASFPTLRDRSLSRE